ncbi:CD5 antigen-like [Discoglossus pictus]
MELALPLSCYLLWISQFGVTVGSLLRSSLASIQNESVTESRGRCQGIVLIFNNQTKSLVCDDHWGVDSPLAHVVCQESGCGTPNSTWKVESSPSLSTGALEGLQCTGNESQVSECENPGQIVQLCATERIAALSCNQDGTRSSGISNMRLSRGRSPCDGHVEVFDNAEWSPLCFTGVKESSAEMLCSQMGCKPQRPLFTSIHKGRPVLGAVTLQCLGNNTSMWECEHRVLNMCLSSTTTYLQCNRARMEESWLVWVTIFFAALMIVVFCCVRVTKSGKCCTHTLNKHATSCLSRASRTRERYRREPEVRRGIYHREPPNLTVQEANSPPSSPAVLQDPIEVNALLAPHGFRLNNTITPPPSYMHALKVLSRPLENTQTPPPSYLEALKILSRPVLVHVNAEESSEEKEDLAALMCAEKEDDTC